MMLGRSASTPAEAKEAELAGAGYIGAGPVWASPSKPDADPRSGSTGSTRSATRFRSR